ncbi:MAG TPA: hypothetical protein VLC10_04000 [Patescibacteria group bacterium]|nr:hypothetical protein [Patescibacteria group bacterium]
MKASKIFMENGLDVPVYLTVKIEGGELLIIARRQPVPGAEHVPAGKAAVYRVTDALRQCFDRQDKLRYEFRNKLGMAVRFSAGREKTREGPIMKIEPLLN